MKRIFFGLILLYANICFAAVYIEQNNGSVTYSDTPSTNSKRISLPATSNTSPSFQTTPGVKPSLPATSTEVNAESATGPYKTFLISSPKDQDTIQNQPTISVDIKIEPELKKGDKIQLLLDNKLTGSAQSSTHLTLNQVERGIHQVYAVLLNADQKILQRSNTITIYVHRASANFKPS